MAALPELSERLARCFAGVFRTLPSDGVEAASVDTLAEWDSLAAVTLLAVVEEEFGIIIGDSDFPELRSFEAIHAYLAERASATATTEAPPAEPA